MCIRDSSRRGEGLGYYGLMNNTAMALGPMTGLFMHGHVSYNGIFLTGMAVSFVGLLFALGVKKRKDATDVCMKNKEEKSVVKAETNRCALVSLDRFVLLKGIPVSVALLLLSIPYGATTNFVAMYASEIHLYVPTGFFFSLMAAGMGVSRIFAGKKVDHGYVTQCIHAGYYPVILAFLLLGLCRFVVSESHWLASTMFFIVPALLGVGFGAMFPAMNTLYINLARHDQRATATSTYLTAWDVGIGIGVTVSGVIAHHFTFYMVYLIGSAICLFSLIIFTKVVTPHYKRNDLSTKTTTT